MKLKSSSVARLVAVALLAMTFLAGQAGASAASTVSQAPSIGIGKSTPTPGTTTGGRDDASIFARYLSQESTATIIYGPKSGSLVHDPSKITTSATGLDVVSFIAHATFDNPYAPTSSTGFDFGILLRLSPGSQLRVIVTSNGNWYLTPASKAPIAKGSFDGVDASKDGSNSLDLVAAGADGYLGVNGKFVTKLDLSSVSGKGDVAVGTAFFTNNFQKGATTTYKNFTVWSVDQNATTTGNSTSGNSSSSNSTSGNSSSGNSTTSNSTSGNSTTSNSTSGNSSSGNGASATPVASGEGYVSKQFGYTIGYDSTWTASDATSDDKGDYVRLSNGISTVDFTGYNSAETPDDCITAAFKYYSGAAGYSNVAVAKDSSGKDIKGTADGDAYELMTFTYKSSDGTSADYVSYVECRTIQKGVSMLNIAQFVDASKFNDQVDAVNKLLDSITINGQSTSGGNATQGNSSSGNSTTGNSTGNSASGNSASGNASAGNSTSGNATNSGAITFRLVSQGSPVGLVQISVDAKDSAKTDVHISASGLPSGSIALIHKGTCDNFSANPVYYLNDFNADGNSDTVLKVAMSKLAAGGYVVTIHQSLNDLGAATACGAIGK